MFAGMVVYAKQKPGSRRGGVASNGQKGNATLHNQCVLPGWGGGGALAITCSMMISFQVE